MYWIGTANLEVFTAYIGVEMVEMVMEISPSTAHVPYLLLDFVAYQCAAIYNYNIETVSYSYITKLYIKIVGFIIIAST